MPESIVCPSCRRSLLLPAEAMGQEVQCPGCATQFRAQAAPPPDVPHVPVMKAREIEPTAEPFASLAVDDAPILATLAGPKSTPRPVRRRKSAAVAVLLVAGLAAVACLMPWWGPWLTRGPGPFAKRDAGRPLPPLPVPPLPRDDLAKVFGKPAGPRDEAQERTLAAFFTEMGAALQARDQGRIMNRFDLPRMGEELIAQNLFPIPLANRPEFLRGLDVGMRQAFGKQDLLLTWEATEIKDVQRLQPEEVVVIARHRGADGVVLKMRWWLTRQGGPWKIYDYQDLDMGLRTSTLMGVIAGTGRNNVEEVARGVTHVTEAMQAVIIRQNADEADQKLRAVAHVRLPAQLEGLRQWVTGLVQMRRGQYGDALNSYNRAHDQHPDMPSIDLFKGLALNGLQRWDEARTHLETYRDLLGDDATVCQQLGIAFQNLRRFPEAAVQFRKALDYNPKDAESFIDWLRTIDPNDPRDEVGPLFAKLDQLPQNFAICAEDCWQAHDVRAVEAMARVMQKIDGQAAAPEYYLALVKASDRQGEAAAGHYKKAAAREFDAVKKEQNRNTFLEAMARNGQAVAAYPVVGNPRETFRKLAEELKRNFQTEEMRRLVAAHRKAVPGDPLLSLYQAEVDVRGGNYARADKAFAEAKRRNPDAVAPFRDSWVLARYHTGQALKAYAEIGPAADTFRQLAMLATNQRNDELLGQLIKAHEKTHVGDPDLLRYDMLRKVRLAPTDEAVAAYQEALSKHVTDDRRRDLTSAFLFAMVDRDKAIEGYQALPDATEAFQLVASDLQSQNRPGPLRKLIELHRVRRANDPWLAFYTGELQIDDQAWDEAAASFRTALDQLPKDRAYRAQSNYLFASYRAGHAFDAYETVADHDGAFYQLGGLFFNEKKWKELEILVARHRGRTNDVTRLQAWELKLAVLTNQHEAAAEQLREAYEQEPNVHRKSGLVNEFMLDMVQFDRGLEGYRAAPDKATAFSILAQEFVFKKNADALEQLLAEQGKAGPKDVRYRQYEGELHLLRGEAEAGRKVFAAALTQATPNDKYSLINGLRRAQVMAGKAVDAYREAFDEPGAFASIATICKQQKDANQLSALVAAYRLEFPDERSLPGWDLDVRWLKNDYQGVLDLLADRKMSDLDRDRWKSDDYEIRSLIKLGRTKEAIERAEKSVKERQGNQVLLVLAQAHLGGAKAAVAALENQGTKNFLVGSCYRDADLGPLLRSEPFQAFRDRFPEPPQNDFQNRFDDD